MDSKIIKLLLCMQNRWEDKGETYNKKGRYNMASNFWGRVEGLEYVLDILQNEEFLEEECNKYGIE